MTPTRGFHHLPLLWKILSPFVILIFIVGPLAAFLMARDVSSRADAVLNRTLVGELLDGRARIQDRGLYLFEAANQAANLQGMATAVVDADVTTAAGLLRSVLALKPDLEMLAIVGKDGTTLTGATRTAPGAEPAASTADLPRRLTDPVVAGSQERSVGIADGLLLVATPICAGQAACTSVGAAVSGLDLGYLLRSIVPPGSEGGALALYGHDRRLVSSVGPVPDRAPTRPEEVTRHRDRSGDREMATVFGPFELDGRRLGTLAVGLPADAARTSGPWKPGTLAAVLFAGMAIVMVVGVLVARSVLAQVRVLHGTSRALARGELGSRAPVLADDEIGDLARVLNRMAEELQASHELLEARVEERTEEVSRLLQQRTEFFASLSHELRTPLAVILSQARIQLDPAFRGRRGSPTVAWKTVEASADQLLGEVNAVLELARASSGRLEVRPESVDVRDLVARVHTMFLEIAATHGISIDVDLPDALPPIHADPALVREVLTNLVDNAVKYTASGGHVVIGASVRRGSVDMSVVDSGIGIPSEAVERIFEPFYRAPGAQTQHGEPSSGLGLAVAKQLIELQGGTIDVAGAPEGGTVLTVTLPRTARSRVRLPESVREVTDRT